MGVTIEIAVPDQATRDRLAHQWSRAVVAAPDALAAGRAAAQPGPDNTEASRDYGLTTQVTMAALRATAGQRINLHAGGVSDERRRVLAVVGPSGTGKTTATMALARRLGYVSDETVSIDPAGTIAPHPKPLSVIVEPGRRHHKEQLSPDDLGLLPTPDQGRLARLVLLHRGVDGQRGLARLGTAEGMLQIIEQSSSLAQLPRPLHTLLTLIEGCGGLWALRYDEITDHVDELVDLLAGLPPHQEQAPAPTPRWHEGEATYPLVMDADGPLLARLPWAEAVEVDDQLIVLTATRALLLADLTATVWLLLARPCSVEELVRAAEQVHGAHPHAAAIVGEAVTTLVEQSLAARGTLA
jgi:hypothetical protein